MFVSQGDAKAVETDGTQVNEHLVLVVVMIPMFTSDGFQSAHDTFANHKVIMTFHHRRRLRHHHYNHVE